MSDFKKISNYWRANYTSKVKSSNRLTIPEYLKKMIKLVAPGKSYYYIVNFHTMEIEYISDSVKEFTGLEPSTLTMEHLLSFVSSSDIDLVYKKEQIIQSFYMHYLKPTEMQDYKIMYTYKMKHTTNSERIMLHQATPLSLSSEGCFVHVLGIHSDITPFSIKAANDLSFIHINGGQSFFNVNIDADAFTAECSEQVGKITGLLTNRELQVVREIALGSRVSDIAKHLNISEHTVHTHKKNILKKAGCKNSTHLITLCLAEGLIQL
ncbi:response regulator transcription factor [Galbibacter mesophilus]|uniref:response regulator transcription factor n=1 Tax=Galbibacter mesophilus TaxID=379069 RepID=UPI00191D1E38|nr:LuxR C-terminal-related transcriptional regulator [Galbibacter mesophilus]MCM5661597.1 LuxR C-terminal-related transcriptional regulator [Galbibacter mesophilus]